MPTKIVNGVSVDMPPQEVSAFVALQAAMSAPPTVEEMRAAMPAISILQAELAAGPVIVQQIEDYMALPDTPWAMKRAYAKANVLERNSQMVDSLAWVLGWTQEQVDQFFAAAVQIRV